MHTLSGAFAAKTPTKAQHFLGGKNHCGADFERLALFAARGI